MEKTPLGSHLRLRSLAGTPGSGGSPFGRLSGSQGGVSGSWLAPLDRAPSTRLPPRFSPYLPGATGPRRRSSAPRSSCTGPWPRSATLLGCSYATARVHVFKARRRLAEMLGPEILEADDDLERRLAGDFDVSRRMSIRTSRTHAAVGGGGRPWASAAQRRGPRLQTAAVAAFAIVVLVPSRVGRPAPPPTGGRSWRRVDGLDRVGRSGTGIAGAWTIQFPSTGVLEVTPPSSFSSPYSGYSFRQTETSSGPTCSARACAAGWRPGPIGSTRPPIRCGSSSWTTPVLRASSC